MNPYLKRLEEIFGAIDSMYSAALDFYEFGCSGCTDNCCRTKFHHHMLAEELYLAEGLGLLGADKRAEIISRAGEVVRIHNASPEDVRVMCPLNEEGLCILYAYRPMICRIHGVPYEMQKRDGSVEYGIGCYRFMEEKVNEDMGYFMFNRTMFYIEMANVEKEARKNLNYTGNYSRTTAEMILDIAKKDQ